MTERLFSKMITFIGVETAGKTTLSRTLARDLGGHALRVPAWPSLDKFLSSPVTHAFTNQREAMEYTVSAQQEALRLHPSPLLADNSPDRIHLAHSWKLKEEGMLSESEWEKLERQYEEAQQNWGSRYVYLRVGLAAITQRLQQRGRPEDLGYNLQSAATFLERWEAIVADAHWRENKEVLEVNGESALDEVHDTTKSWVKDQLHKEAEHET